MKTLLLTQHKAARVDDADYAVLSRHKWTYLPNKRRGYAVRWESRNGKRHTIYMHRQITGALPGQIVDHEDGDGLNNQRANLRVCDQSLNQVNRAKVERTIPYRGVHRSQQKDKAWKAQIKAQQRVYHLGGFLTQAEAARAYDRAAMHFFGSFARLNFPDEIEVTRVLPLARTIVRHMQAPQQLALPLEEPLPEIQLGRADWLEITINQAWRAARVAPVGDASAIDDLL